MQQTEQIMQPSIDNNMINQVLTLTEDHNLLCSKYTNILVNIIIFSIYFKKIIYILYQHKNGNYIIIKRPKFALQCINWK